MNKPKPNTNTVAKSGTSTLLLFIVFFIGGAIGYLAFKADAKPKEKKLTREYAKAESINDVYVFISALPAVEYETVEMFEASNDTTQSAGSEAVPTINQLLSFNSGTLTFDERLSKIMENIKAKFPDANGAIFSDGMEKCEVVRFKD